MTKLQTEDIVDRKIMGQSFRKRRKIALSLFHLTAFSCRSGFEANDAYSIFGG